MATTKKRKVTPMVDALLYMQERPQDKNSGEIIFSKTKRPYIMMDIRNMNSFLDENEAFLLLRALHRTATGQFGVRFHERVQNYVETVKVIA